MDDPEYALIYSEHGADWIRFRQPISLRGRNPQVLASIFRTHFDLTEIPRQAILYLRAMKRASVWLNNQIIYSSTEPFSEWKKVCQVDLASKLRLGRNWLYVQVQNQNGHPALLAYCKPLGLLTSEHWDASQDGVNWTKSLGAHKNLPLPLSRRFSRTDQALLSKLYIFVPIFLLICGGSLLCSRYDRPRRLVDTLLTPSRLRWVLLGSWGILAVNNMWKIPTKMGMDWSGHAQYIRYVAENWRIPLATEGWQMFQSPLYYVVSAVLYKLSRVSFSPETTYQILRLVPLLCGAVQIELSYRALRYVYPDRKDLQILGILIGGLLPMNLYISQFIGNEPLAGCLAAMVVVFGFRLLSSSRLPSTAFFVLMGLILGLAVLAKITPFLLVPPLILFIGYHIFVNRQSLERPMILGAQRISLLLGVALLVSGWYYGRNWIYLGKPFVGGWDPSRGITWWQDPGFRTVSQFFTFGESLFHPIYSATAGLWDSLYSTLWMDGLLSGVWVYVHRPPWNYGLLLSSSWLSLLPFAAILLGILVTSWKSRLPLRPQLLFALSCIVVHLFAILYLFVSIPIYSTAKATYTLGLIPCYAVLGAAGFEILTRKPFIKAIVYGSVGCWAVAAYLAYFVI
jgi:hypothetical protein